MSELQPGDKGIFIIRCKGVIVDRDAFYTTIASRGLEITVWNDEVELERRTAQQREGQARKESGS